MSFTDPQTVTISAVTTPLPRTSVGENESTYQSADGLLVLSASHQYNSGKGGRTRRVIRIDTSKITADPFEPADNVKVSMGVQLIFDLPPAGYTAAEALAVYTGFKTQISASSDAIISKLLGGES